MKNGFKKLSVFVAVIITLIIVSTTVFALPSEIDSFSFVTTSDAAKSSAIGGGNTSIRTVATLVNTGVPTEYYYIKLGSKTTGDFMTDGAIRTATLGNFASGFYYTVVQKRDPNIGTTMTGWVKIFQ